MVARYLQIIGPTLLIGSLFLVWKLYEKAGKRKTKKDDSISPDNLQLNNLIRRYHTAVAKRNKPNENEKGVKILQNDLLYDSGLSELNSDGSVEISDEETLKASTESSRENDLKTSSEDENSEKSSEPLRKNGCAISAIRGSTIVNIGFKFAAPLNLAETEMKPLQVGSTSAENSMQLREVSADEVEIFSPSVSAIVAEKSTGKNRLSDKYSLLVEIGHDEFSKHLSKLNELSKSEVKTFVQSSEETELQMVEENYDNELFPDLVLSNKPITESNESKRKEEFDISSSQEEIQKVFEEAELEQVLLLKSEDEPKDQKVLVQQDEANDDELDAKEKNPEDEDDQMEVESENDEILVPEEEDSELERDKTNLLNKMFRSLKMLKQEDIRVQISK